MAAQFTATNAPEACGPLMWMARATTSLPVPDSPWTSTVAELPAHGQDDVPTLAGELTHRARQVRRGIHFEPTVVGPLPQVLEQTAGAPALAGDHENPQERQCLLTRRCGRDRGLHVNSWNHPLVPAPPRYRATSTSASSVPLPWRARM